MAESKEILVRLTGSAVAAVEELGELLGGGLTPGQIVGLALGTELYLARLAKRGDGAVWIEQGKYRQKLTVAPTARGDYAGVNGS